MKSEYELQAEKFLKETNTELSWKFVAKRPYFDGDKKERDVWMFSLVNGRGMYAGTYGASLADTERAYNIGKREKPSAYDLLASITKCEPPTDVDEFAEEYGYTKPSVAIRVYNAVTREWDGVQKLWTAEEIEKLSEIQ